MADRLAPADYVAIRSRLFELGYGDEWEWGQTVQPPVDADDFAGQAIWVVCCSGFREQAARVTERKVRQALRSGQSARTVFPRSPKGPAIDRLWNEREERFAQLQALLSGGAVPEAVICWVALLPFVGGVTLRYHFAKNLGVDCAKPDRWLCRLAGVPEDWPHERRFLAAMDVCRPLAAATGDRIATVDLVLWRACNLSILGVTPAGEIAINLTAGEAA